MEIMITDKYKLKTVDELNMRLFEWRAVRVLDKPLGEGGRPTGETRDEWVALDAYFQDIPSAVASIYKRMQRNDPYSGDLAGALLRMERIAEQLSTAVSSVEVG